MAGELDKISTRIGDVDAAITAALLAAQEAEQQEAFYHQAKLDKQALYSMLLKKREGLADAKDVIDGKPGKLDELPVIVEPTEGEVKPK